MASENRSKAHISKKINALHRERCFLKIDFIYVHVFFLALLAILTVHDFMIWKPSFYPYLDKFSWIPVIANHCFIETSEFQKKFAYPLLILCLEICQ